MQNFMFPLLLYQQCNVIDNKIVEINTVNKEKHIRELFDSSYQGVKNFFPLAYDNTEGYDQFLLILSENLFH